MIDAERGLLLRVSARLDGREFHLEEMAEIAFDEKLPDETFRFEPSGDHTSQGE